MNLTKQTLETKINKLMVDIGRFTLGEMLAGGVVSDIYRATFTDKKGTVRNVVIRYTKGSITPNHLFSKSDIDYAFSKAQAAHNLDLEIQADLSVPTPTIIKHFPKEHITVM